MFLLHIQEPEDDALAPTIRLEDHIGEIPPYAILSHRWGLPVDEVTFQDMMGNIESAKQKKGYKKVESCCMQTLEYGLNFAWIDTCCIDKSSSAELSEAVNSMWSWYRDARICFAYLNDVPYDSVRALSEPGSPFRRSAWFDRGWTLQELIAPHDVIFFPEQWGPRSLGDKNSLADIITSITGIRKEILRNRSLMSLASIAERMSWASRRRTTRLEDEGYSLMGIFDVNMATIYGEGRKAFMRLQEEIMRTSTDQTIFAWSDESSAFGMLATSPHNFKGSANYHPMKFNDYSERFHLRNSTAAEPLEDDLIGGTDMLYSMTNFGLQISLPLVRLPSKFQDYYLAFLACSYGDIEESTMIFLKHREGRPKNHLRRVCFSGNSIIHRPTPKAQYPSRLSSRLLWISDGGISHKLDLKPPPNATPPCRLINLLIVSRIHSLDDSMTTPKLQAACDLYPRGLWHDKDYHTYARFGPDEYVTLTFDHTYDKSMKAASLAFVFGLHDNRIWYNLDADVPLEPAEILHEDYDMFQFGKGWSDTTHNIEFWERGSQRQWPATCRASIHEHSLHRLRPTFTDDGGLVQNFELLLFRIGLGEYPGH